MTATATATPTTDPTTTTEHLDLSPRFTAHTPTTATGGANVSAFAPMDIPHDLRPLLAPTSPARS